MPLINTLNLASSEHDVHGAWAPYLDTILSEYDAIEAVSVHFVFSDKPHTANIISAGSRANDLRPHLERGTRDPYGSVYSHNSHHQRPVVAVAHPLLHATLYVVGENREALSHSIATISRSQPLMQALALSYHILRAHHATLKVQAALDNHLPMLLVDKDANLHGRNRLTDPFFDSSHGLATESPHGQIAFNDPKLNADFKEQLSRYFAGDPVTRKIRRHDLLLIINGSTAGPPPSPQLACLTLRRLGQAPRIDLRELQASLGLTRSQAKLAEALIIGEEVKHYAVRNGITHKGANWHLSGMMKRLNCHRREQLVRLLLFFIM